MIENEKWFEIWKFPNYELSDNLRLRHAGLRRIKKFYLSDGYLKTNIQFFGKKYKPYLHQLVALVFVPNPENKPEVHHIDEDITNNHWSNLMWVTRKEHAAISKENGQIALKITKEGVLDIRNIYRYNNEKELADKYKVRSSTIYKIATGQARADVGGDFCKLKDLGKKVINTETGEIFRNPIVLSDHLGIKVKYIRRILSGERVNSTPFRYIVNGVIMNNVLLPNVKPEKPVKQKVIRIPKPPYIPHPIETKPIFMYNKDGQLVQQFKSTRLASEYVGSTYETFRKQIKKSNNNFHKGFIWKYA